MPDEEIVTLLLALALGCDNVTSICWAVVFPVVEEIDDCMAVMLFMVDMSYLLGAISLRFHTA